MCGELWSAQAARLKRGENLLLVLAGVAGASGTVGLDDAGGGMVGIGHDREAYAKNPSDG